MPSLGFEWIRVQPEDGVGEPYKFKSEVTVSKEGIFGFSIPEELVPTAENNVYDERRRKKTEFELTRPRQNTFVTGKERDKVLKFVHQIAKDYLKCEVTRELVILYCTESNLMYYKTEAGEIFTDGYIGRENGPGSFKGDRDRFDSRQVYSLGLMAKVYEKTTARRKSGDQVSYEVTYGGGSHFSKDTWLQNLNSFCHVDFDPNNVISRAGVKEDPNNVISRAGVKEMPYTEKAAKFFYDAMMALCVLSDRIETLFASQEALTARIAAGSDLLLPAPKDGIANE